MSYITSLLDRIIAGILFSVNRFFRALRASSPAIAALTYYMIISYDGPKARYRPLIGGGHHRAAGKFQVARRFSSVWTMNQTAGQKTIESRKTIHRLRWSWLSSSYRLAYLYHE